MVLMPNNLVQGASLDALKANEINCGQRCRNGNTGGYGRHRTAGVGRSAEELNWDLNYLLQVWQAIQTAEQEEPNPSRFTKKTALYCEPSGITSELMSARYWLRAKQRHGSFRLCSQVMPHYSAKLKPYSDAIPPFSR